MRTGQYKVVAKTIGQSGRGGPASSGGKLWATSEFSVIGGQGGPNVSLTLRSGLSVSGAVATEDPQTQGVDLTRFSMVLTTGSAVRDLGAMGRHRCLARSTRGRARSSQRRIVAIDRSSSGRFSTGSTRARAPISTPISSLIGIRPTNPTNTVLKVRARPTTLRYEAIQAEGRAPKVWAQSAIWEFIDVRNDGQALRMDQSADEILASIARFTPRTLATTRGPVSSKAAGFDGRT